MTTIVDGTTGITFPSAIAGVSATQQYSGRVLQCLQYRELTGGTLTSTSFVQLGSMTLSITPTSSSSKILAIVSLPALYLQFSTGPAHCYSTLYKNGANLGTGGISLVSGNTNAGNNWASAMFSLLDSPATTSTTTYAVYVRNTTGSVGGTVLGEGQSIATLTLMEIAG